MTCVSPITLCVLCVKISATWYSELEISCVLKVCRRWLAVLELRGFKGVTSLQCLPWAWQEKHVLSFLKGTSQESVTFRDAAVVFLQTCRLVWALRKSSIGMWCWRPVLSLCCWDAGLTKQRWYPPWGREGPPDAGGEATGAAGPEPQWRSWCHPYLRPQLFPSGWFCRLLCITDFEQFDNDVPGVILFTFPMLDFIGFLGSVGL